jgi:hypothetical protein
MSFLNSLLSLPREGLTIAATILVALVVVWLCTLFSRQRFVTIKRSEETELMAFQLRRIADAVEQIAARSEMQSPVDSGVSKHLGLSTFGH